MGSSSLVQEGSSPANPASSTCTSSSDLACSLPSAFSTAPLPFPFSPSSPAAHPYASAETSNTCRTPDTSTGVPRETHAFTPPVTIAREPTAECVTLEERGEGWGRAVGARSSAAQDNDESADKDRVVSRPSSLDSTPADSGRGLPDVLVFDGDVFGTGGGSLEGATMANAGEGQEARGSRATFPGENGCGRDADSRLLESAPARFLRRLLRALHLCESEEEVVGVLDTLGRPDEFDRFLRGKCKHSRDPLGGGGSGNEGKSAVNSGLSPSDPTDCNEGDKSEGCKKDATSKLAWPRVNFSLVFFSAKLQTLFFCRDKCGARSLLIDTYTTSSSAWSACARGPEPADVGNAKSDGTCASGSAGVNGHLMGQCRGASAFELKEEIDVHMPAELCGKRRETAGRRDGALTASVEGQRGGRDVRARGRLSFFVQGSPDKESPGEDRGDSDSASSTLDWQVRDQHSQGKTHLVVELSSTTLSNDFLMKTAPVRGQSLFVGSGASCPSGGAQGGVCPGVSKRSSQPCLGGEESQRCSNGAGQSGCLCLLRKHGEAPSSFLGSLVEQGTSERPSARTCEEVPVTGVAALSLSALLRSFEDAPRGYRMAEAPSDRGERADTSRVCQHASDVQNACCTSSTTETRSDSLPEIEGSTTSPVLVSLSTPFSFLQMSLRLLPWPHPSVLTSEHFWCTLPDCQRCILRRASYWEGKLSTRKTASACSGRLVSTTAATSTAKQSAESFVANARTGSAATQGKESEEEVPKPALDVLQLTREEAAAELLAWLEESVLRCCTELDCEPLRQHAGSDAGDERPSPSGRLASGMTEEPEGTQFVAVLFSGGVDSSLLAALVCRLAKEGRLLPLGAIPEEPSCLATQGREGGELVDKKRDTKEQRKRRKVVVELVNVAFEPMAPDRLTGLASFGDLLDLVATLQPRRKEEEETASTPREGSTGDLIGHKIHPESHRETKDEGRAQRGGQSRESAGGLTRNEGEDGEEGRGDRILSGCSPVDGSTREAVDLEVRFVAVDVSEAGAVDAQKEILRLAAPHGTHMDLNIASALFFAMK